MSNSKKIFIFAFTMLLIFVFYPVTVFADEFNPIEYWSSPENTIKTDYLAYDGDASFSLYKIVMWDKVNERYLLIYSSQVIPSFKAEIMGNGEYRQITSRCSYLGGGDSQGTWVLEYSPFEKNFYVADNNGGWTLLTKNVDKYYNVSQPYKTTLGIYDNYIAITNSKPIHFSESVNNFYYKVSNQNVTTLKTLNVNYNGILDEIVLLIPVIISVIITYLAIRKGLSFLKTNIVSA